jgi:hypothetical protein
MCPCLSSSQKIKKVVRGSHAQRLECTLEVFMCRGTVDLKLPFGGEAP